MQFIPKLPSPAILNTVLSGLATLTPIEAPKPNPIVPSPPDDIKVLGVLKLKYWAVHIWCCPTSVVIIKSPLSISLSFSNKNLGVNSSPSSLLFFVTANSFNSSTVFNHSLFFFSFNKGISFCNATFMSPIINESTFTFLFTSAGSTSICITLALLINSLSLITLSLNLAPKAIIKSHFVAKILDALLPCIPIIPVFNLCSDGIAPLHINVVATGAFNFSAKFINSSVESELITPPPA